MKFRVIVADPPWQMQDELTMTNTKRGASANYDVLSLKDLKELDVKNIAADDAVLALWVPSSLLKDGLEVMEAWGFRQTQTHIWIKTKKDCFKSIFVPLIQEFKRPKPPDNQDYKPLPVAIKDILRRFNFDNILAFGMGRVFRQTHEVALIGVRGKVYGHLDNKSQRSVHFYPATKHSTKPENLQDMLEKMFPHGERLEMFARRNRQGWTCVGIECPTSIGEDIRASLDRLKQNENPSS